MRHDATYATLCGRVVVLGSISLSLSLSLVHDHATVLGPTLRMGCTTIVRGPKDGSWTACFFSDPRGSSARVENGFLCKGTVFAMEGALKLMT